MRLADVVNLPPLPDVPDVHETGTPGWWLKRMSNRLVCEADQMRLMRRYYRGEHPTIEVPQEIQEEYQRLVERSKANFMRTVVDTKVERMKVLGFRTGPGDAAEDGDAWMIWQANHLDAELEIGLTDALVAGRSYLSVWPNGDTPSIVFESPEEVIVENTPGNPRQRAAALKLWLDDWTGQYHANVFLPGSVHYLAGTSSGWEDRKEPFAHNWGVPIVPLPNRPQVCRTGFSELDDVTCVQDRINEMILNRMLAAWLAAYRQKWATGIDIPTDPSTGEEIEPYEAAIDRLWTSTNENAKFGTFDATDLKQYLEGSEQDIVHLSVISATPRHYLIQQGQSPSGDAMRSANEAMVQRVLSKQEHFGEGIEEAIRLARRMQGAETSPASEVRWRHPEEASAAEKLDAAVKKRSLGIPLRYVLEDLDYSTAMVQQILAEAQAEQLLAALTEPDASPADPEQGGGVA